MTAALWLKLRLFSFRIDRRAPLVVLILFGLAFAVLVWNVGTGEYPIAPLDVLKTILHLETGDTTYDFVVNTLRLPRALTAFTVGAMLALAGGVMQTLTRNPLASPDLTGVTAGASLGAIILLVLFPSASAGLLPLAALVGGLGVAAMIYALAWRGGDSPIRLILVGIGLTAALSSVEGIVLLRVDVQRLQNVLHWLTGSLYARSWENLWALAPWCLIFVPLVLASARHLNALHLGEEVATGLGARVTWQRAGLLLASAALTGAAISQVGTLGFVGLIAPHLARRLVGPMHEGSQLVAALAGGLLVLTSDFVGRAIFAPTEIPAGIVIALVGAPFFIYLLWKSHVSH
jgi:iron complex transport system permease protein